MPFGQTLESTDQFSSLQFIVCHKLYKSKEIKLFRPSWRGSPRETTGLIRNGFLQLNNKNKILS